MNLALGSDVMEFRLIYDGPLRSASNSSRKDDKHRIRTVVHEQLEELANIRRTVDNRHVIKNQFVRIGNCDFWPLVTEEHAVFCHLDILFLRSGKPGSVIVGGDLDNRLKTLFDALRVPRDSKELPEGIEDQMYRCLLKDDSLITGHSVTTDRLLLPASQDETQARIVIRVQIEPMIKTPGNVGF